MMEVVLMLAGAAKPELIVVVLGNLCMWYGGLDRRYPGASSEDIMKCSAASTKVQDVNLSCSVCKIDRKITRKLLFLYISSGKPYLFVSQIFEAE